MMSLNFNPLNGRDSQAMSNMEFVNLRNSLYSRNFGTLLGSLPQGGGVFSPDFMMSVNDAKLVTPRVINNYMAKAEEVYGSDGNTKTASRKERYKTIVDEILERSSKVAETKTAETSQTSTDDQVTAAENPVETASPSSTSTHYGIVGEIFDKYA